MAKTGRPLKRRTTGDYVRAEREVSRLRRALALESQLDIKVAQDLSHQLDETESQIRDVRKQLEDLKARKESNSK